jgi:hypothetical protein
MPLPFIVTNATVVPTARYAVKHPVVKLLAG